MSVTAVILAAGQGKRMHSALPKVLHPLLGQPLITHALRAVHPLSDTPPVVVVGHAADAVCQAIGETARCVYQEQQLGTAHALLQAGSLLRGSSLGSHDEPDLVLMTNGDMPLLRTETLERLVQAQRNQRGPLTLLSVETDEPLGYGRVLRAEDGSLQAIVEESQATPEQLALRELNVSAYCFDAGWLWPALERIPLSPKGEYYLTDIVELAVKDGLQVQGLRMDDAEEAIGVNTRLHLAKASQVMQQRINRGWMETGVTMIDPAATYIEPGVTIGPDTVLWPNTFLHGNTQVGEGCELGPNTIIRDTRLGNHCYVLASVLEHAVLEDEVEIGPFGHLRKGAHLAQGVHMGNFGEVKNSYLGPETKMGHFSYIGDATIGKNVNIGAGTITCNFDGERKHHTEIGADVFIGSDTMLVAPLTIEEGARTGAGAVVTKDVEPYTLVVGVPARPLRKLEKRD